ncbi:MAG: DUF2752 domain-containing protein [Acidobacteria bacterium]|nr:MAG: DUF2752 domain-containing protein [Acidobacteriota bacterium]
MAPRRARIPALCKAITMAAACGLALALLFFLDPARGGIFPPCPFRALTGYLCPGCGTLRALHQLLHGHLGAAFRLNPLSVSSLPFVGYSSLSSLLELITGRPLPRVFVRPSFIWALLFAILAFWVLRNTPLFPAS